MNDNSDISFLDRNKGEASENQLIFESNYFELYRISKFNRWFVKKKLKKEYAGHPVYTDLLKRELEIGIGLQHANIVRYFDYKEDPEPYILTEYVDGKTLKETAPETLNSQQDKITRQICEALSYLHENGIYHLDIKPQNIILTSHGKNVKLIDLGYAYQDSFEKIEGYTPGYRLPDDYELNNELTDRDIYSLGKTIAFIAPGQKRIINKCTSADKGKRYQNIGELLEEIHKKNAKKKRNLQRGLVLLSFVLIVLIGVFVPRLLNYADQGYVKSKLTSKGELAKQEKGAESKRDTVRIVEVIEKAHPPEQPVSSKAQEINKQQSPHRNEAAGITPGLFAIVDQNTGKIHVRQVNMALVKSHYYENLSKEDSLVAFAYLNKIRNQIKQELESLERVNYENVTGVFDRYDIKPLINELQEQLSQMQLTKNRQDAIIATVKGMWYVYITLVESHIYFQLQ